MSDTATPPVNELDDKTGSLRAYFIVMSVLAVLAIGMRFVGRLLIERDRRFWWDDWAALASVPTIFFLNGVCLAMIEYGLGRHIQTIPPENLETFLKIFWTSYFAYDLALFSTKFAAILFLSRVFPKRANATWFNWAIWITHGLNASWLVGTVLATAFFCSPIEKNWLPTIEGKCGNTPTLMMGSSISSVIIDLTILFLPLPKIWGLKMDIAKKSGLTGVFLLGYLVVVVSIGRLITVLNARERINADLSWEVSPAMFWFLAEAPMTLLCICLPACLPILRRVLSRWNSTKLTKVTAYVNSRTGGKGLKSKDGNFPWSEDPNSFTMSTYGRDKSSTTESHAAETSRTGQIGQAVSGRDSLDSDGSKRGILPQSNWHASHVEAGGNGTTSRSNVPEWSIRVDRDVAVHR